jgi:hypothetical protein
MDDLDVRRVYISLFGAILMFVFAVGGTLARKLPGRFGGVASPTKNPKQYWSALAIYYVAGIGFLWYYLYLIHRHSQ